MAAMTRLLNRRNIAGWFRLVALLEAVSWVGLLIGMYFKYVGSPRTELGVKVFGPAHGAVFVAFVALGLLAAIAFRWATGTWLLGIVASIVPLASVIFLIWVDRTGRLGAESVLQPGQPVAETT
nr:DUF3817 domain-containing protein [Mycolicibacterium malmesburyense]CRL69291.1 integral membrane protein [Mycolicibacterium malmesburyense]